MLRRQGRGEGARALTVAVGVSPGWCGCGVVRLAGPSRSEKRAMARARGVPRASAREQIDQCGRSARAGAGVEIWRRVVRSVKVASAALWPPSFLFPASATSAASLPSPPCNIWVILGQYFGDIRVIPGLCSREVDSCKVFLCF
jgi:hypothetical protein